MADWIKMRSSLVTNPKVIRMARVLLADAEFVEWFRPGGQVAASCDEVTKRDIPVVTRIVTGALVPTWSAVNDTAARDGILRHATSQDVDESAGVPGFGRALEAVDWMRPLPDGSGVQFINFEEHNSPQKERSLTAKTGAERTKEWRERRAAEQPGGPSRDADGDVTGDGRVTSQRDDREEKREKKEKNTPIAPKGARAAKRFEEFWLAWPKSERKQDRVKCEEKWKREGLDACADAILADIRAKRGTRKWQEDGGKFIEAPLVYLNGRRWEDNGDGSADDVQETIV
jgi:hypothetical protein